MISHEETHLLNRTSLRMLYAGTVLRGDVLDVGCNSGFLLDVLRRNESVTSYIGIDESAQLIDKASDIDESWLPAEFHVSTLADWNPGKQYDSIFCGEVIEHVDDAPAFLADLKRLLRPDGLLLLTTPVSLGFKVNAQHTREFTPTELAQMLIVAGFKVTSMQFVSQNKHRPQRLLQMLECEVIE